MIFDHALWVRLGVVDRLGLNQPIALQLFSSFDTVVMVGLKVSRTGLELKSLAKM